MSSTLPLLLKQLVHGLRNSGSPCFQLAKLTSISDEGTRIFLDKRILKKVAPIGVFDHPLYGQMHTARLLDGWVLVDPERPGIAPISISESELEQVCLDQLALARWIADENGLDDARSFSGDFWSLGQCVIRARRCTVFYLPSPVSSPALSEVCTAAEEYQSDGIAIVIAADFSDLDAKDILMFRQKGLILQSLHSLVSAKGFEIDQIQMPHVVIGSKAVNCFRRTGTGWQIRFQGGELFALNNMAGMDEIWFLLRNPGQEFQISEIANQLAGAEESSTPVRSHGSQAKSVRDLPPVAQGELKGLLRDKVAAEEAQETERAQRIGEEIDALLKRYGVKDSHANVLRREGDDAAKEAERAYKAIGRVFSAIQKTKGLEPLADHLAKYLQRRNPFSYTPEQPMIWET